jgi:hypothetical protein
LGKGYLSKASSIEYLSLTSVVPEYFLHHISWNVEHKVKILQELETVEIHIASVKIILLGIIAGAKCFVVLDHAKQKSNFSNCFVNSGLFLANCQYFPLISSHSLNLVQA